MYESEFPYTDFNKVNLDWISDELKADKQQIAQNTADIEELKAGGTVIDYEDLQNLPEINGVTLIGDKSLEDIGAASADELSDLKSAFDKEAELVDDTFGKVNIGNLIMSPIADKIYRYNSSTNEIYTQDNTSYMSAVIDVTGISHVTSTVNFSSTNYHFFGTDTTFVATGASCRTSDAGYVFAVPAGATKLYLSYERETWNIAVCEGRDEISNKTISDFPVGGTYVLDGYEKEIDKIEDVYPLVNRTSTRNVQYLDNSKKTSGYYYGSNGSKIANASYAVFDPVTVPAGTYYISTGASPGFSYIKTGTTFTRISAIDPPVMTEYQCYVITLAAESTLYITISASSSYKVDVSTIPMKPNADEYRYGSFLESPNKVICVGSNRPYKTLKSALEAVADVFDAYVYVDPEEFDLVDEFGETYLDNYSTAESFGLVLKNRVHLIFASGSKVVFNYTGSNAYIHEWFSPFNAGRFGFELIGANIESTNCRYSVHDEHGDENEPYRNIYKGCSMKHDSTGTTWGAHQCIGGGLGLHGTIDIEDCKFHAVGETIDASYHAPNTSSSASSRVSVRNSYFNGTFRMSKMGTGTTKSHGFVSGNSMATSPYVSANTGAADNVDMIEWNNVIRA